ncbi:MAG: sigma-70 family RNA polymerase sigma factor [Acidobacteriota bacterium]
MQDDILPRLGAGESGAAEQCLDRYGSLVWSLARRHTRTPAEAEDAVQEIFLSIWKHADRFDPAKASETTFVAMVARRRLIDLFRRKDRRPETAFGEGEQELVLDVAAGKIEERTDAGLAARAIQELKPKERQAVMLSIYQGMSHSEISNHLKLPIGSVKTYIRRGLAQVRKTLQQGRDPLKKLTVAT